MSDEATPTMTRQAVEDLVEDLIQAYHDYEMHGGKSYRDDYHAMKRKVIDALAMSPGVSLTDVVPDDKKTL